MKELTPRQREYMLAIQRSIDERGYPPTMRELMADLGVRSLNGIYEALKRLERKGWLSIEPAGGRAITVLFRAVPVWIEQNGHVVPA